MVFVQEVKIFFNKHPRKTEDDRMLMDQESGVNQLKTVNIPQCLQGFVHPRWLFGFLPSTVWWFLKGEDLLKPAMFVPVGTSGFDFFQKLPRIYIYIYFYMKEN